MIAADTNVLLRTVISGDDPQQAEQVRQLVARARAEVRPLFVSDVVLCELIWVLRSRYRVRRPDLARTLRALAGMTHLSFESTDRFRRALGAFEAGRGDFSDYLVREHAREAGCDLVATFDQDLLREPGFVAP